MCLTFLGSLHNSTTRESSVSWYDTLSSHPYATDGLESSPRVYRKRLISEASEQSAMNLGSILDDVTVWSEVLYS